MSKRQSKEEIPNPIPDPKEAPVEAGVKFDAESLFARQVNGGSPIKSITLKRVLTRPLISVAHHQELYFECSSEVFERELPSVGRQSSIGPASMVDGIDLETRAEITLVLNAMMLSALERASGVSVVSVKSEDGKTESKKKVWATPLTGRAFCFHAGAIQADKKYRVVNVAELNVTR